MKDFLLDWYKYNAVFFFSLGFAFLIKHGLIAPSIVGILGVVLFGSLAFFRYQKLKTAEQFYQEEGEA